MHPHQRDIAHNICKNTHCCTLKVCPCIWFGETTMSHVSKKKKWTSTDAASSPIQCWFAIIAKNSSLRPVLFAAIELFGM